MKHPGDDRFQDSNLRLGDFLDHLIVHCPQCAGRADLITQQQRVHPSAGGGVQYFRELRCSACFHVARRTNRAYRYGLTRAGTDSEFDVPLWLRMAFRDEIFWACNYEHLAYLKAYIAAKLRERHDRRFATMVEKLPGWMKAAKNRVGLLKVIEKLEGKI